MIMCIVDLPYAYFRIDVEKGKIIDAAPIGRWMIGKTLPEIQKWALTKNGIIKVMKEKDEK